MAGTRNEGLVCVWLTLTLSLALNLTRVGRRGEGGGTRGRVLYQPFLHRDNVANQRKNHRVSHATAPGVWRHTGRVICSVRVERSALGARPQLQACLHRTERVAGSDYIPIPNP